MVHLLAVMACVVRWLRDSLEERSFLEEDRWCRWLCSLRPEEDGEDLWRDARWLDEELFLLPLCRCRGERLREREEALRLRLCEPCRLDELSLDSRRLSSSLDDLMGELSAEPASL